MIRGVLRTLTVGTVLVLVALMPSPATRTDDALPGDAVSPTTVPPDIDPGGVEEWCRRSVAAGSRAIATFAGDTWTCASRPGGIYTSVDVDAAAVCRAVFGERSWDASASSDGIHCRAPSG